MSMGQVAIRRLVGPKLKEYQARPVLARGRDILYYGKLLQMWDSPKAVAKYLAEELRVSPFGAGAEELKKMVQNRWNVPGFVPKMLKLLGEYLEDQQPVFDKVDYAIVDIVDQHPHFTSQGNNRRTQRTIPQEKMGRARKARPTVIEKRSQKITRAGTKSTPSLSERFFASKRPKS